MIEQPHNIKVTLVDSFEEMLEFRDWMKSSSGPVAVDTETSGLEVSSGVDRPRLIQIGDKDTVYCIPEEWFGAVRDTWHCRPEMIMHNASFDQHALASAGLAQADWAYLNDTMLIARLVDPLMSAGLKPLAEAYVSKSGKDAQSLLNKKMKSFGWTWATVPVRLPEYWVYGGLDVAYTAMLYSRLRSRMPKSAEGIYDLEMSIMPILNNAERKGMLINRAGAEAQHEELEDQMSVIASELRSLGVPSPSKNFQIGKLLADADVGLTDKTPSGAWSTASDTLEKLDHPVARKVLEWRGLKKLKTTYIRSLLDRSERDGRIYPSFNQMQAKTGRMSMSNPNLQNQPRGSKIRNLFVSDEDKSFIGCDYSQQEIRIAAAMSDDPGLIEDIKSDDFFSLVSSRIYGEPVSKDDPRRHAVKTFVYASSYGAGTNKIASQANISLAEAKRIRDKFVQAYPKLNDFRNGVTRKAPNYQTPLGRPLKTAPGFEYAMYNALMQGIAADQTKYSINDLNSVGLADDFVLTIHDEVIVQVFDVNIEEAGRALEKTMTNARYSPTPHPDVVFEAEANHAKTLGGIK